MDIHLLENFQEGSLLESIWFKGDLLKLDSMCQVDISVNAFVNNFATLYFISFSWLLEKMWFFGGVN